jgi:hypothetical protein
VIAIKASVKKNSVGLLGGLKTARLTAANNILKVSRVMSLTKTLKYLDIDFKQYA